MMMDIHNKKLYFCILTETTLAVIQTGQLSNCLSAAFLYASLFRPNCYISSFLKPSTKNPRNGKLSRGTLNLVNYTFIGFTTNI